MHCTALTLCLCAAVATAADDGHVAAAKARLVITHRCLIAVVHHHATVKLVRSRVLCQSVRRYRSVTG